MNKSSILVICTGNSCRSQMAEGFLKHHTKLLKLNIDIFSAGVKAEGLNKKAVQVMKEIGIDISQHSSNTIDEFNNIEFSHIITVCDHANENCPVYLKKAHLTHQNFLDPSKIIGETDLIDKAYEKCRDDIGIFTSNYLTKNFND